MNRRGVLAALLCSPALLHAQQQPKAPFTVELDDNFVLEVKYRERTIKLNAEQVMDSLQPMKIVPPTSSIKPT